MASIWDNIKNTAGSLKGAVEAPAGVVWDLASMPFNDEDDDFGSVLDAIAGNAFKVVDPLINPKTATGATVTGALDAMNWALDNGVNRPISTMALAGHHATASGGQSGFEKVVGIDFDVFSADTWAKAWEMSDEVNAGQAIAGANLSLTDEKGDRPTAYDPFDYQNPYDERTSKDHTVLGPAISWGANITGALVADPAYLGLKAAGAANQARMGAGGLAKLNNARVAELGNLLSEPSSKASGRVTKWANFVAGENKLGRPLTADEIRLATPELNRWSANPRAISALIEDASKIGDDAERLNAVKGILAVSGGDPNAIRKLQSELTSVPDIADALKNITRGNVLDLKMVAADPKLSSNPLFVQHLERQLDNINSGGSIDKMMDSWANRLDMLLATKNTLSHLPGVHRAGYSRRALNRSENVGLARTPANFHRGVDAKLDAWEARRLEATSAQGASLFIQKSLYHTPVMAVKSALNVGFGLYTKAPINVSDALRTTHFANVAKLDAWEESTTQLDAMMKLANVLPGERMGMLSRVMLAHTEGEKQLAIRQVEKLSVKSLAARYAEKNPDAGIDSSYIERLMDDWADKRSTKIGQSLGRAYAATKAPEGVADNAVGRYNAVREKGIAAAEDAVSTGTARANKRISPEVAPDVKWNLRVDSMLDEDGLPMAAPLFETQLKGAVPLLDVHLMTKLMARDQTQLSKLSKAWRSEMDEADALITGSRNVKGKAAVRLQKSLEAKHAAADWLVQAGSALNRGWKMSVLFRLGYPVRVVLDDHWRIWSQIGAGRFYAENVADLGRNYRFNAPRALGGAANNRFAQGKQAQAELRERAASLRDELEAEHIVSHSDRLAEFKKANRAAGSYKGQITRLRKQIDEGGDSAALTERIADYEGRIADHQATAAYLQAQMGERSPEVIQAELDETLGLLRTGARDKDAFRPQKRRIGESDVNVGNDQFVPGGFAGGHGAVMRSNAGSNETFETQMKGMEDVSYRGRMVGSYRTINTDEPGYYGAWADVLNNQLRNSQVAMHFIKGGSVDDFAKWVAQPEQAVLRRRLAHYAHDAEDWGLRVERMIADYIPNEKVADRLMQGKFVTEKYLRKETLESQRFPVHGREAADTLGTSAPALGISRTITKAFSWLAEVPTDRLSRHPYFNSMYKQHVRDMVAQRRLAAGDDTLRLSADDLEDVTRTARGLALADVKRTLFDMTSHSHAAHVMRFMSPFFAAHQEVLARWWRIAGENPGVVRRFTQAFDAPRHAGVVVDENGEPVKPGDEISFQHKILLPDIFPGDSSWSISENSFNLVLQGGLTNPGAGPVVTVPLEHFAVTEADNENVAKVARVFNPFPPNSPLEAAFPATVKRFMAATYGLGETQDSSLLRGIGSLGGIGNGEWNDLLNTKLLDANVDFEKEFGRSPTKAEANDLIDRAKKLAFTDATMRFLNNSGSPFPARPSSKYAAIQQGGWRLKEAAREKYPNDWEAQNEWVADRFRSTYGEAYMALLESPSTNAAGLTGSPSDVHAYKTHRALLGKVDPRLRKAIMGPLMSEEVTGISDERTDDAANFFEDRPLNEGEPGMYFDKDDPRPFFEQAMASKGWREYEELTGALTAIAQQNGMNSFLDDPALRSARTQALAQIKENNYAFREDIEAFDAGKFDSWLTDMEIITKDSKLRNDPLRSDIAVLGEYLEVRKAFDEIFEQRKANGLGGPDAQDSQQVKEAFTQIVSKLVESNTYFESNIFNGMVEYDPYLIGAE